MLKKIIMFCIITVTTISSTLVTYAANVLPVSTKTATQNEVYNQISDQEIVDMVTDVYSFVEDDVRRSMYIQTLTASLIYNPENQIIDELGDVEYIIYFGSISDYNVANSFLKDGSIFFSGEHGIYTKGDDMRLFVPIIYSSEKALVEKQKFVEMYEKVQKVKAATLNMNDTDKATYIANYISDMLQYTIYDEDPLLVDIFETGKCDCSGYNSAALLLFGNCGIPYRSIETTSIADGVGHILGYAKIEDNWKMFDICNYDNNNRLEGFIFGAALESKYYSGFTLIEEI